MSILPILFEKQLRNSVVEDLDNVWSTALGLSKLRMHTQTSIALDLSTSSISIEGKLKFSLKHFASLFPVSFVVIMKSSHKDLMWVF